MTEKKIVDSIQHQNMNKNITRLLLLLTFLGASKVVFAGNPDRQGEAGAYELLLNPWARSAGLNLMNTAMVTGVEATFHNVAGLSRINNTEFGLTHSIYLQGTGLGINSLALATKMGSSGALGINLTALSFGKIPVTTTGEPEGTGATYSPTFFNLGISYAKTFENKVSVGLTLRVINEALPTVSAFGFAIDAGVQYVNGSKTYPERFKLGILLRNIGDRMRFGGQGLTFPTTNPDGTYNYQLTYAKQAQAFELPSQLLLGIAYDLMPQETAKLTFLANFTANSFGNDDIGGGLEFSLNKQFALRGSYRYEINVGANPSVYTGLAGGVTVQIPLDKEKKNNVALDYSYQATNTWKGTHNISFRVNL